MQFIKKNLRILLLTPALMLVSSLIWGFYLSIRVADILPVGFPFQFYLSWGPCPRGESCTTFNPVYLVLDFFIWYLVSAFVIRRSQE